MYYFIWTVPRFYLFFCRETLFIYSRPVDSFRFPMRTPVDKTFSSATAVYFILFATDSSFFCCLRSTTVGRETVCMRVNR